MEFSAPAALSNAELVVLVRDVLASSYAHPIVTVQGNGVAVLGGKPLARAREAIAAAHGDAAAARIVELDVAGLPWCAVPAEGLRLWRQYGASGADGEVVTELVAGDPPLQLVVESDGWQLMRAADGAQGWIETRGWAPAEAPPITVTDVASAIVRPEAFVAAATELLDTPYVWGGTTASGVDCSGLVQRAAWQAGGCWLPRHSRALLRVGRRTAPVSVDAGDILVLQRDPSTFDAEAAAQREALAAEEARTGRVPAHGPAVHPMHCAIATSPTEAIHASRDAMRVVREPLDALLERYRVLGVRRLAPQSSSKDAR